MSKSLIKLVDNSLLPAAIMVLGKFIGIILTLQLFHITYSVKEYSNSILSYATILKPEDVVTVTSYSDLIMYFILAIAFTLTVLRAIYFHNSHVKPTLVSRLANKNLLNLIQNSYEIYHTSAVWLVFTWVSAILITLNALNGKTLAWIAIAAIISNVVLTVLILQDVYREIENIKHHPGDYQWE